MTRTDRPSSRLALVAAAFLLASPLEAQIELAHQAKLPPLRPLGAIQARSSEPLGAVSTAVPLPGGRVLVNDVLRRRVVLFDSTLANVTVVADSTSATANAYGARGGGLLAWGGDSALFVDPASLSMMVVTPKGVPFQGVCSPGGGGGGSSPLVQESLKSAASGLPDGSVMPLPAALMVST